MNNTSYLLIIALILALCEGCSPDHYTAIDKADNSRDARWSVWKVCMKEAQNYPGLDHGGLSGEQVAGAMGAGVIGGGIGGAIFGSAVASDQPEPNSEDAYIRNCMLDKGYKYTGKD
jgi:hypothetical protein